MHHNKRKTMQGPPNAQQRPPASYMQRMPLSSYSFTAFHRCSIAIVGRTRNGLGDHEVAEPVFYLASRMRLNPKLSQKNALRRKSKAVIGSSLAMHLRPADPLLVILPPSPHACDNRTHRFANIRQGILLEGVCKTPSSRRIQTSFKGKCAH